MRKTITILLGALVLALALGACGDSLPEVTPPLPPTLLPGQATATAVPSLPTATATAAATATATISPTLPVAVTAEAIVVETLNIRSGPGIDYPVVGGAPASTRVTVLGQSTDGLWLKIECPVGVVAPQCWIIGGEAYAQVESSGALPAAPAPPVPPTPAPSPTATPLPCVVRPPADWTSYQVASGDTLSGLAGQFGTSVEALMATNCLSGDLIQAGSSLYVPANGAGALATADSGAASDAGVEAGFKFGGGAPGNDTAGCKPLTAPTPSTARVTLLDSTIQGRNTFIISDLVCIQPRGFVAGVPIEVKVRQGQADVFTTVDPPPATTNPVWTYALRPGYPAGMYEVRATQGGLQITTPFTVTKASPPAKIRVLTPNVAPGTPVEVILAGLRPGKRFYLYQLDSSRRQWTLLANRVLPLPDVNSSGEAVLWVPTMAEDSGRCFLVHSGLPESGAITRFDPRVFAVGTDPKSCN